MPRHNNRNTIHAQRLRDIRKFVDFNYDLRKPLSAYAKRKIKTYWDEINALTARPYQVYRPRNKARLEKAQEYGQHENKLKGLKVAFLPTSGEKVSISFNKSGELVASTHHVTTRVIQLDVIELAKNPKAYITRVLQRNPVGNSFTVLCGRYEIPVGITRSRLADYVVQLTSRYDDAESNSYFGNWLHGIAAHNFKNQSDFQEYIAEKSANKKKLQLKRKNAKRRAKYKANK